MQIHTHVTRKSARDHLRIVLHKTPHVQDTQQQMGSRHWPMALIALVLRCEAQNNRVERLGAQLQSLVHRCTIQQLKFNAGDETDCGTVHSKMEKRSSRTNFTHCSTWYNLDVIAQTTSSYVRWCCLRSPTIEGDSCHPRRRRRRWQHRRQLGLSRHRHRFRLRLC